LIDPKAIIHPTADLGKNVTVGPWTTIGPEVSIGKDCVIGSHVVIKGPTVIGSKNRIYQFSSVGEDTPALAYQGEPTLLRIGNNNVIREGVTIHRGMVQDEGVTEIGNDCLFMAYVHIAHDCTVGNNVIMANNASISGHVKVGDYANFGGYSAVPQFRIIGAHTHIAGLSLVLKDVPAFVTVAGNPSSAVGLNLEGMRRRGFSPDTISALKASYRVVYQQDLLLGDAIHQLESLAKKFKEVSQFVDSISSSKYGIVRPRKSSNNEDENEEKGSPKE
tara:strand:- start:2 stop:829 length:828 start_codon:yes stop_codon:yes gene_type:complete